MEPGCSFITQSFRLLGDCLTRGAIPSDVVEKEDYCDDYDYWSNLPADILELIVGKFSYLRDYYRFIAVCRSWRDSLSHFKKPCLPLTEYPFLLLAEDVAPGAMLEYDPSQDYSEVEDNNDEEDDSGDDGGDNDVSGGDEEEEDSSDDDDDGSGDGDDNSGDDNHEEDNNGDDEDNDKVDDTEEYEYDHNKISVGSSRGFYSLLTGKTYYIDLPEAAGRLIVGTNKGWQYFTEKQF